MAVKRLLNGESRGRSQAKLLDSTSRESIQIPMVPGVTTSWLDKWA
mgnify:CR=1 FL=1